MNTSTSIILLIGSGRLSQHLEYWNSLLEKPNKLYKWNRKQNSIDELLELLTQVNLVWLAISDSALVPFYEKHLIDTTLKCVHFSGALSDSRMICTHPLMSFPAEIMAAEVYEKIHFAMNNTRNLEVAMPGFKNNSTYLEPQQKSLYHSLCVVAGNFPQLLWSETFKEFQRLQIPNEAVELYIHQITQNFIKLKDSALTGPLIRKDQVTLDKNLMSLDRSPLKKIYQTFIEVFTK